MKYLFILLFFLTAACNNSETVTSASSSDSSIKAIDPNGTIRDTSQYDLDTLHSDSASQGVTH